MYYKATYLRRLHNIVTTVLQVWMHGGVQLKNQWTPAGLLITTQNVTAVAAKLNEFLGSNLFALTTKYRERQTGLRLLKVYFKEKEEDVDGYLVLSYSSPRSSKRSETFPVAQFPTDPLHPELPGTVLRTGQNIALFFCLNGVSIVYDQVQLELC